MNGFTEVMAGAHELHVTVEKGDIALQAAADVEPALEWSSDWDEAPEVERDGDVLRVRQRHDAGPQRLDLRFTVTPEIETIHLHSGAGRVDVAGPRGRLRVKNGNGAVSLRDAGGEAEIGTGSGAIDVVGYEGTLSATSGHGPVTGARVAGILTLRAANGYVEVLDATGRIEASSGNGHVALTRVAGEAEVNTGRGTIEIGASRSLAARAVTGKGAIRVEGGAVRGLRLKTGMGEIVCAATLEPGRYEVETGMGTIEVSMPDHIRARVEAQTGFGRVDSDIPLVRVGRSGPMSIGGVRMVGSTGAGEPECEVSLRTGKGDIMLRKGETGTDAGTERYTERSGDAFSPRDGEFTIHSGQSGDDMVSVGKGRLTIRSGTVEFSVGKEGLNVRHAAAFSGPGAGPPRPVGPPDPPIPPTPLTPPASSPSGDGAAALDPTLAILEAVARGDISPAEAEDLLSRRLY